MLPSLTGMNCYIGSESRPKYKNGKAASEKCGSVGQEGRNLGMTLDGTFVYAHAMSAEPRRCRMVFNKIGRRMTDSELMSSELIPASDVLARECIYIYNVGASRGGPIEFEDKGYAAHIIDEGIVASYEYSGKHQDSMVEIKTKASDILSGRVIINIYGSKWLFDELREKTFPNQCGIFEDIEQI